MRFKEELKPKKKKEDRNMAKNYPTRPFLLPFTLDRSGHRIGIFGLQAPSQNLAVFVIQQTGRHFPEGFH